MYSCILLNGYVASASPVTMISPFACGKPVLYALPYPFLFSNTILAPFFLAISWVLSFESPSIIIISRFHLFFLKYSLFIESIVFPIPFSSFKVGKITLIVLFVVNHSSEKGYKQKWLKRFYKKL